jgi:SAM-dependent methyltransferase
MDSEYLSRYYELERNHWWFKIREKIILQQLRGSGLGTVPLSILNLGAATGRSTEVLQSFGQVTSVEIDPKACQFLRDQLKIEVFEASVTALPFPDQSFDLICAFDVIEHVEEDGLAIRELKRVCKRGGKLYLTVPAYPFLWSQHDRINHHYRRYTAKSLKRLVSNEFTIQYISYFNTVLFIPIAALRLFRKAGLSKKPPRSDFEGKGILSSAFLNRAWSRLFGLELFLLRHIRLPFGVSLLARIVRE